MRRPLVCGAAMRLIDTKHLGREKVIGCWEHDGVLIDPGPAISVGNVVEALDGPPRAVLLTHTHLDHAGGTGTLVRRFPEMPVYVHEIGAPKLADPAELVAAGLFGDDAAREKKWGELVAVPEENLRPLSGGEEVEGFQISHAPGHAPDHVTLFHPELGCVFGGDNVGVRILPSDYVLPAIPPPDFDIEAWNRSLDAILDFEPKQIALTHFGLIESPAAHIELVRQRLREQLDLARGYEEEGFAEALDEEIEREAGDAAPIVRQALPVPFQYAGLKGYLDRSGR